MSTGRMLKHRRTARCFNNMGMQLRQREVEVTSRCSDMELSLTGEEG